jgi:hypothetical protein
MEFAFAFAVPYYREGQELTLLNKKASQSFKGLAGKVKHWELHERTLAALSERNFKRGSFQKETPASHKARSRNPSAG